MEHPVGFQARDVLVEEKVALSFLPFLYFQGLGYGHAVHTKEPQLGDIVIDVQGLILAFPHCLMFVVVVA